MSIGQILGDETTILMIGCLVCAVFGALDKLEQWWNG